MAQCAHVPSPSVCRLNLSLFTFHIRTSHFQNAHSTLRLFAAPTGVISLSTASETGPPPIGISPPPFWNNEARVCSAAWSCSDRVTSLCTAQNVEVPCDWSVQMKATTKDRADDGYAKGGNSLPKSRCVGEILDRSLQMLRSKGYTASRCIWWQFLHNSLQCSYVHLPLAHSSPET